MPFRPQSAEPARLDVLEAARGAAFTYVDPDNREKGVPAVAAKMGMSPGVLWNKLNLDPAANNYNKLTVQDLVQIIQITGDLQVIKALCFTFGCVAFPVPNLGHVSDEALLELVNKVGAEGGDFYRSINAALSKRRATPQQIATIHKEGMEFIGAIVECMERTKGILR